MACAAPHDPDDRTTGARFAHAADEDQSAYLVIDVSASRVDQANAAGRLLLGLTPSVPLPVALDSAMPALQRLRQIAAGASTCDRETLTFWLKGQVSSLTCTVKPVNANGSKHLMQLRSFSQSGSEPAVPSLPLAGAQNTTPVLADEPLPPIKQRDDAETLREIARRIREGQRANPNTAPNTAKPAGEMHSVLEPATSTQRAAPAASAPGARSDPAAPLEIAKLAHELKTPLSAIVAASEIMRDQQLGPMGNDLYLEYAGDIHESARHALAVITDMLDAATGALSHKSQLFDLNDLTAAIVSAMQPLAQARGLTLAHETSEGRLEISANATAIRQILLNLMTNATKFTGVGGEVHVGTGYLADGSIYLVVRDTGDGMDENMLARAFFEEPGELRPRDGGGYGLGLPMVRNLAEANGGTIEIDSAIGRGTVVLISFPTRR